MTDAPEPRSRLRRWIVRLLWIAGALALLIQLVPYGRGRLNPPVRQEPAWDTPRTRDLARRACFDCHSNEARRPWYGHVAPISWLLQRDIDQGRRELNFSEWDRPQKHADEAAEEVEEGKMPPGPYLATHPDARLSDADKADLIRGLKRTVGD